VCIYGKGWKVQNFGKKKTEWIDSLNVWIDSDSKMTSKMNYEDWYASDTFWIDSNIPRWRLIRFKLLWIDSIKVRKFYDTIHLNMNRFRQGRSEKLMMSTVESIHSFCKSIHMWIDSRKLWIDSLWYSSGKLWIDSLWYYSAKL